MRRPHKSAVGTVGRPLQRQIDPGVVPRRASLDRRTLTPDTARQLQRTIGNRSVGRLLARTSTAEGQPVRADRETSLPDDLKSNIERLSGLPMGDVRVHHESARPARVMAQAYTQGTTIHLQRGQERHLAHEAWHVVQQKQGRVKPTLTLNGVRANDDPVLEHEADRMGSVAARYSSHASTSEPSSALQPNLQLAAGDVAQMNGSWAFAWEFLGAAANLRTLESLVKLIQGLAGAVATAELGNPTAAVATSLTTSIPLAVIEFWNAHKEEQEAQGEADRRRARAKKYKAVLKLVGAAAALITLFVGSAASAGFLTVVWLLIVEYFGDVVTETWASLGQAAENLAIGQ